MAEKVCYCTKCKQETLQTCLGKVQKKQSEKKFDRIATVATLGMYFFVDKIANSRPKLYMCRRCYTYNMN